MPDWRNPADYAYTANLTLHDWAWEFLRRNAQYRAAWRRFTGERKPGPVSDAEFEIARSFGLACLSDPSCTIFGDEVFWLEGGGVKLLWGYRAPEPGPEGEAIPWPGYPDGLALWFDLAQPIESQVKTADALLRRFQAELQQAGMLEQVPKADARVHVGKWSDFLRVLDADVEGVSPAKVGEVLFASATDPRDQARKVRAAARRLVNGGYRRLLLKPNILATGGK
ncbi:MAG TPA: DUF6499 domain-containing protein [Thermoanaerobaculia bacterium]|nr:DUF6499 domain-containing protein [Thermoanaerobaculia bacterium]